MCGHCPKQSLSCVWFEFQEWVVQNSRALEPAGILGHSIEDTAVHAIACPGVIAPQGFQNNQGLMQPLGPLDGAIQSEIPGSPAEGNHPVENESAILAHWCGVALPDTDLGN
jgi:hypothetical protein